MAGGDRRRSGGTGVEVGVEREVEEKGEGRDKARQER